MKVWLATFTQGMYSDYSMHIIGVYADRESAVKAVEEDALRDYGKYKWTWKNDLYGRVRPTYDEETYEINEYVVQKSQTNLPS